MVQIVKRHEAAHLRGDIAALGRVAILCLLKEVQAFMDKL